MNTSQTPARSLFPGCSALSASFPCSLFPAGLPRPRAQARQLQNHYASKVCFGLSMLLLTCLCSGCCLGPSEVRLTAAGEAGRPRRASVKGPWFTSCPSSLILLVSHSMKSILSLLGGNHRITIVFSLPLWLGKPLVPYPPARASQGNHPMNTLCPGALCRRATPRRFMRCPCRQRSVLRPYHSFLTLTLLS